jgi:hypothetical protein
MASLFYCARKPTHYFLGLALQTTLALDWKPNLRELCGMHRSAGMSPAVPRLRQEFLLLEWQSAVTFLYPCVFGRIPVGCAFLVGLLAGS